MVGYYHKFIILYFKLSTFLHWLFSVH